MQETIRSLSPKKEAPCTQPSLDGTVDFKQSLGATYCDSSLWLTRINHWEKCNRATILLQAHQAFHFLSYLQRGNYFTSCRATTHTDLLIPYFQEEADRLGGEVGGEREQGENPPVMKEGDANRSRPWDAVNVNPHRFSEPKFTNLVSSRKGTNITASAENGGGKEREVMEMFSKNTGKNNSPRNTQWPHGRADFASLFSFLLLCDRLHVLLLEEEEDEEASCLQQLGGSHLSNSLMSWRLPAMQCWSFVSFLLLCLFPWEETMVCGGGKIQHTAWARRIRIAFHSFLFEVFDRISSWEGRGRRRGRRGGGGFVFFTIVFWEGSRDGWDRMGDIGT